MCSFNILSKVSFYDLFTENDKSSGLRDNGIGKISQHEKRIRAEPQNRVESSKIGNTFNSTYPSEVGAEIFVKRENEGIEDAKDEVINYEGYVSPGEMGTRPYSFSMEDGSYKQQSGAHDRVSFEAASQVEWNAAGMKHRTGMKGKFLHASGKNESKRNEHEKRSRKKEKLDGVVYRCNQCGKIFKTRYTLSIHLKMPDHTQNRPFVCNICGKGFRLSSTLCRHKIIHTDKKPHKCPSCDKSFNRSSTLKTHMRTHSEEKSFVCDICGKGFHQKGNLRNHVMIHTGEKPFKCSKCDRAFNKMSNLKFHMHTHSGNLPYQCKRCKKRFTKKTDLKQHNEEYH